MSSLSMKTTAQASDGSSHTHYLYGRAHAAYFITEGYLEKTGLGLGGSWGSAGSNILMSRCMRPMGFPFFTGSFGLNRKRIVQMSRNINPGLALSYSAVWSSILLVFLTAAKRKVVVEHVRALNFPAQNPKIVFLWIAQLFCLQLKSHLPLSHCCRCWVW